MPTPDLASLLGGPTAWHMGALHPVESVLVLVLAFGPFLALGAVIWWRRRLDEREEAQEAPDASEEGGVQPGQPRAR